MTVNEMTAAVLAILETLAEGEGWAPEGHCYAALMVGGATLEDWQAVVSVMTRMGVVTREGGHVIRITDKGRDLSARFAAERAANGQAA